MAIKIYTIWVGQGDCTLIQTDTNKLILIDCGTSDNQSIYKDNVEPSIKSIMQSLGKTSIDLLILTHSDKDHCNMISRLFAITTFDLVYFGGAPSQYSAFKLKLEQKDKNPEITKVVQLEARRFNLFVNSIIDDGDFKLWIICGNYPFKYEPSAIPVGTDINRKRSRSKAERSVFDNNGNSLIVVINYKGFCAFFLGDATTHQQDVLYAKAVEGKTVASFQAEIMKMAHHGSPDSFSDDLTNKAVKPPVATASAGVTFGHPSQEAIAKIAALTKTGASKHSVVEYEDSTQNYLIVADSVQYMYNTMQSYKVSSTTVPKTKTSGKKSKSKHAGKPYLEMEGGNWVFEVSGPGTPTITAATLFGILTTKGTSAVTAKKAKTKKNLISLVSNARLVGGRWVESD
jgi:beta-lactamase superfamily II metal-dependent hydrolase